MQQPSSSTLRPSGSTKKIAIKNFKTKPSLPENYENESWTKLEEAVKAIHRSSFIKFSLEELYKAVENLCYNKSAVYKIYTQLKEVCNRHIKGQVQVFDEHITGEVFLRQLDQQWKDHCNQTSMIRCIFLVLDRSHMHNPMTISLWDLGLELFRTNVLKSDVIGEKCISGILKLIHNERDGSASVDRSLLRSLLKMLTDLHIYSTWFEQRFLNETEEFYSKEGNERLSELTVEDYLKYAERRMKEEGILCITCMNYETEKSLLNCMEQQLIRNHHSELLQKGLDKLLRENRVDDLTRLYALFKAEQGRKLLCEHFNKHVKEVVTNIVMKETETTMVQALLDLKQRLDNIVQESFQKDGKFRDSLREAFEVSINKRSSLPAEYIAKYVDAKMRSGKLSDSELEITLDRIMILFRYIQGKDVFEAFYKTDLAKRLLIGKSASIDAEKSMLSKLKQECGSMFTKNLEGMFKDMSYSKDMMTQFRQHKHNPELTNNNIEMTVNVLTAVYWPKYPSVKVPLPAEMLELQTAFCNFYKSKHQGRTLTFQHTLGHCLLKSKFKKERKELQVSLNQALVLLQFNKKDSMTFTEIRQSTEIEETELKRTLQSLACGKARVITKSPKSKDVQASDVFDFNENFSHKLMRIKINQIQFKETPKENQETNSRVQENRKNQIEAAIVRIMKTRKTLEHQKLMVEIVQQVKFPVHSTDIKKRVENLIERDYMKRDNDKNNVYHYVA